METIKKSFILFFCFFIIIGFSWNDCPFGMVNDTYPGECGKYIDTNNNGICDHSEPAPNNSVLDQTQTEETEVVEIPISGKELKEMTIKQVCDFLKFDEKQCNEFLFKLKKHYNSDQITYDTKIQYLKDNYGAEPSEIKNILKEVILEHNLQPKENKNVELEEKQENKNQTKVESEEEKRKKMMIIFGILTIVFYGILKLLEKYGKLSLIQTRKIWNIVLLISFIILTISTIMLYLNIYNIWIFKTLGLHEISGTVLIIASIIHIWERRKFFNF